MSLVKDAFPDASVSVHSCAASAENTSPGPKAKEGTTFRQKTAGKRRSLRQENESLRQQVTLLREQILRLHADLRNVRRRYDRELEEALIYGNRQLLEKLLPLVDDLERSLKISDTNRNFVAFRNGIEMIYRNLLKLLEEEGVRPVQAVGQKFDYHVHDAVLSVHRPGVEPGIVVEELRKGYYYKDRVLRHAKVIVSK